MSVAKLQDALEKIDALKDVLDDITPIRTQSWDWEQADRELKSIRRMVKNELIYQEKRLLANFRQANTACTGLAYTSRKECTCANLGGRHSMGCPAYTANQ
jgi:hypothetical protein